MAPPPHQTESTPSYHTGSARAPGNQVPTPVPTFLGGGSTIPGNRGQAAWWPGSLPQATFSADTSTNCGMDYYPPGGFMNFLQTGQPFIPHFSSPWPPMGNESQLAPPKNGSGKLSIAERFFVMNPSGMQFWKNLENQIKEVWMMKVKQLTSQWHAILEELGKPNKRSLDDEGEAIDISGVGEKERPIGTKKAKKQHNGKGRVKDDDVSLDEDLKKFINIEAATKKRQKDFLEAQESITDKKFETTRIRRESALLESYQKLLCMDTREMTEDIRGEHVPVLKMLREKLAGNSN
uniref:No apical meristem-associated C-terminal domain-containing protein n=1 Tax=Oryza brachyantha TaxID=4533 RepID=J3MD69_ORYBR